MDEVRKDSRGDGPPPGDGMRDSADDGLSTGADPRRCSDGLAAAWDDDDVAEEESGACGAFILDDAPDFSIPVDLALPFLTTLMPAVDDFLTLWVVEAPIDVMVACYNTI
jgi:hypothetical protein